MLRNGIELVCMFTFVDDFEHNLENGKNVADNPAAGVTPNYQHQILTKLYLLDGHQECHSSY
jgi:hypothetical protein